MPIQYFGSNNKTTIEGVTAQPHIADITDEVVDETYDADTATVINDLRTKVDTLLAQLRANGILAES